MGKNIEGKELGEGLSQRKTDGYYSARFTNSKGKRVEKYFKSLKDAKRWLFEAKTNDSNGLLVSSANITVDKLFEIWIEARIKSVRPNTIRNHKERYKRNIQSHIGRMKITSVKPMHCQMILDDMVADYKGSTIYQALLTMCGMFNWAVENDFLVKSPVTRTGVKMPKEIDKKNRALTIDEQKKFLEAAKDCSNYLQFKLVLLTGLRTSELIGLKWSDVDYEYGEYGSISVERNLEYRHSTGEWLWGPPKSKSGYRTIPLTKEAREVLDEAYRVKHINLTEDTPEEFRDIIFLNRKGLPTKNSAYDTTLYKLCDKAGIEHFSMHVLRHTFATRFLEMSEGKERYKVLSELLGHSSINITLNIYCHITDELKQNVMREFNDMNILNGFSA